YLLQCASGNDWKRKLKTPDIKIWTKIITFCVNPQRAISLPFALSDKEFTYHCNIADGLLLDRHRLMAPGLTQQAWISDPLAEQINEWVAPRVRGLPLATQLQ